MKSRLSIVLMSLFVALASWGQAVKLVEVSPAEGEAVSNLDVKLIFDIEEAAESQNLVDNCCIYGLLTFYYYTGYGTDDQVTLGKKQVKYNGQTEDAKYSKLQEFYAVAPADIPVVEGENYTVKVSGTVSISQLGYASFKSATRLSLTGDDNVVISYVGCKPDPSSFYFVGSSLAEAGPQVKLPEVTVTFSQPVTVVGQTMPYIMKSSTLTATAKEVKVKSDDPCSIVVSFEDEPLWVGSYTFVVPKGLVCQSDKEERTNNQIDLSLQGDHVEYYSYKTTQPEINGVGLEATYKIEFDLSDDLKLGTTPVKTEVYLYENEVSDENLCGSFAVSLTGSKFFPHELEIPVSYAYKPETKYIFVFPERIYTIQSQYTNARIEIPFTTPSVENAGFDPIKFGAYNGKFTNKVTPDELKDGDNLSRLDIVDLAMDPRQYSWEWDLAYTPAEDSKITDAVLYDVTSGQRKEVDRRPLSRVKRETFLNDFYVLTMTFDTDLYEGHEYELVIPTKETGVKSAVYNAFIPKADEFTVKLKGTTPIAEPKPLACSLSENQKLEALHTVHWTFPAGFIVASADSKAKVELSETEQSEAWLSMTSDSEGSYLTAIFSDRRNGAPVTLAAGQNASVVLPSGSVVLAGLPDEVANEEIRVAVTGKESGAPETVQVEVNSDSQLSLMTEAVKGKLFTLLLSTHFNWEVSALRCNGTDVTDKIVNGFYTAESLDEDSRFDVQLNYVGEVLISVENGVAEIPNTGIKAYKDGDSVVIEGMNHGDIMTVYTVYGHPICAHIATGETERLTLTPGEIYIIRINTYALKVSL